MDVTHRVASIVLVMIVVVALYLSVTAVMNNAEGDQEDTSNSQTGNLGCIFSNQQNADECVKESSFETLDRSEVVRQSA